MLKPIRQGSTAPSDPPGSEPSAHVGRRTAGGSPLHFMRLPVHSAIHYQKSRGSPPQHQDPDRGLALDSRRPCRTLPSGQAALACIHIDRRITSRASFFIPEDLGKSCPSSKEHNSNAMQQAKELQNVRTSFLELMNGLLFVLQLAFSWHATENCCEVYDWLQQAVTVSGHVIQESWIIPNGCSECSIICEEAGLSRVPRLKLAHQCTTQIQVL